jgi:hypothetical protein
MTGMKPATPTGTVVIVGCLIAKLQFYIVDATSEYGMSALCGLTTYPCYGIAQRGPDTVLAFGTSQQMPKNT